MNERVFRVFLAEDDYYLGEVFRTTLEKRLPVKVDWFTDGSIALEASSLIQYDIYLLDIQLPGVDGLTIGSTIKMADPAAYIIYLTALNTPESMEAGFLFGGADYYFTKPFDIYKLELKLKAVINRLCLSEEKNKEFQMLGDFILDPTRLELRKGSKTIPFPPQEFNILSILAQQNGKVIKRKELLSKVWDKDEQDPCANRNLNVHISRIRNRLKAYCIEIFSVARHGYKIYIHDKKKNGK